MPNWPAEDRQIGEGVVAGIGDRQPALPAVPDGPSPRPSRPRTPGCGRTRCPASGRAGRRVRSLGPGRRTCRPCSQPARTRPSAAIVAAVAGAADGMPGHADHACGRSSWRAARPAGARSVRSSTKERSFSPAPFQPTSSGTSACTRRRSASGRRGRHVPYGFVGVVDRRDDVAASRQVLGEGGRGWRAPRRSQGESTIRGWRPGAGRAPGTAWVRVAPTSSAGTSRPWGLGEQAGFPVVMYGGAGAAAPACRVVQRRASDSRSPPAVTPGVLPPGVGQVQGVAADRVRTGRAGQLVASCGPCRDHGRGTARRRPHSTQRSRRRRSAQP